MTRTNWKINGIKTGCKASKQVVNESFNGESINSWKINGEKINGVTTSTHGGSDDERNTIGISLNRNIAHRGFD